MLVLSEVEIEDTLLNEDIDIKLINKETVQEYDGNIEVKVILCSRATAVVVSNMNFPSLSLVNLTSAGYDGVPIKKFRDKGVLVANVGSIYSIPIAETVVFGILQMAKKFRCNPNNRFVRLTRGYDNYITELSGKKAIILGTGSIGTEVAKRLVGFDVEIFGFAKRTREKSPFIRIVNTIHELKEELPKCDYVISTLPDNDDTKQLINKDLISYMNSECIFINVGRKAVIDQIALFSALKRKEIGGAVLDIFEKVPNPITNIFRRLCNVIVFPGVAAISKETKIRLQNHLAYNLNCIKLGERPVCIINSED
ncbi:NAD(P)-dependent oxidoreductase [Neobacillus sp. SAB-20_R2A]|uniref:NAD(P)-dependent oxidoreductase n=1 Tax=Neobacillus sp. SAB-20_R2A TaxID=3120519 RepID=UPI003C6E6D2A